MNQTQYQRAANLSAGLAARWFPHIDAAMREFGITEPEQQAMFIAQVGHESTGFTALVESFNYGVAGLAGFIRAGRITQDQANMLGRRAGEPSLPLERQRRSPIWYTANASATKVRRMAGSIAVAVLFRSPGSRITAAVARR